MQHVNPDVILAVVYVYIAHSTSKRLAKYVQVSSVLVVYLQPSSDTSWLYNVFVCGFKQWMQEFCTNNFI